MSSDDSRHTDSTTWGKGTTDPHVSKPVVVRAGNRMLEPTRWRFAAPIFLLVAIVVVFMPALDAGLVGWDDDDLLLGVTTYRTLDGASLRWMFTTSYAGHFQPLTWLSYSLDWALWKRQMFGYHLTSVIIHALTALTFYGLVRRLLSLANGGATDVRSPSVVLSALFASALFALHPLRAETVAWLAGRSGLLAGFFYVLCVTFYVRYAGGWGKDSSLKVGRLRWWAYGGSVVACALSLLAKASAVTLPFVLLILDRYPLGRIVKVGSEREDAVTDEASSDTASAQRLPAEKPWSQQLDRVPPFLLDKIPFLVLAIAAGVRAYIARRDGGALYSLAEHDVWARTAQALYGLVFYLWKTVWPSNLGPLYTLPPREVLLGWMLWGSGVIVLAVGVLAFVMRRRLPSLPVALAAYVIVLLPVLGLIHSGPQLVADRYSYVSCLAFAMLGGGVLYGVLRWPGWGVRTDGRAILGLAFVVVLAILARTTYAQATIWISGRDLWWRGIAVSPTSAIAHTNYADALVQAQMLPEAAGHYQKALDLDPYDVIALHHFADLQRMSGHTRTAIGLYLRALVVDPHRHVACLRLAEGLERTGRPADAIKILRQGVADNPGALDLSAYLADLLSSHPDDTLRDGEEAVRLALYVNRRRGGEHLPSMSTLACAYAEAGRFENAIEVAGRALVLAEARGDRIIASELSRRLNLFRKGQPYRAQIR